MCEGVLDALRRAAKRSTKSRNQNRELCRALWCSKISLLMLKRFEFDELRDFSLQPYEEHFLFLHAS